MWWWIILVVYVSIQVTSGGGLHIAFNYWDHPPDALDNPKKPYTSDFWVNDWKERGL